jgi:uncharacterized OB-fold protein
LATGLPKPVPAPDGLDAPFWEAAAENVLKLQHCGSCDRWQWGPEWICHHCHSDKVALDAVEPTGRIYSFERVWHPVHPALQEQGPYLIVLVEFPQAGDVRMVGNLLGDPNQDVKIGSPVEAVFEHHREEDPPFTLIQWQATDS